MWGLDVKMDYFDAAKEVHKRILEYEPDPIATKIVGYVYLQENPEQEMIRLASGTDNLIQQLIKTAKVELRLAPMSPVSRALNPATIPDPLVQSLCFGPSSSRVQAIPPRLAAARYWDTEQHHMHNSDFESLWNYDSLPEDYGFQNRFMSLDDPRRELTNLWDSGFGEHSHNEATFNNLSLRQSPSDVAVKICHYFIKGHCKHGSNCRYSHGWAVSDNYSQGFGRNLNEFGNEDHSISPGSLAKLEKEITDLLKCRGGIPISIASLPLLYNETYGRELEGEGYLRESQRHGKAGYSLTKLLARMKSIQLIDRPHGQHVVILAEDAPNYMVSRGERNEPGEISNARQIYLTFPAESTFSEEDVSNYFSAFGAVQDVRIPCQTKRMFGFVTFISSDTVKIIFAKGNPHYVCGARVLVKPYIEKSKLIERKYHDKLDPSENYPLHHMDFNSQLQAKLLRQQHQLRQLQNSKLVRRDLASQSYFAHSMDGVKVSEDHSEIPSQGTLFNYMLFNVPNINPAVDDNNGHSDMNFNDHGSNQGLDLPDSPFATVVASSISALV